MRLLHPTDQIQQAQTQHVPAKQVDLEERRTRLIGIEPGPHAIKRDRSPASSEQSLDIKKLKRLNGDYGTCELLDLVSRDAMRFETPTESLRSPTPFIHPSTAVGTVINYDNHGSGHTGNRHDGLQNTTKAHPLHISIMSLKKEIEDHIERFILPGPNSELAQSINLMSAGTWYKINVCYKLLVTEWGMSERELPRLKRNIACILASRPSISTLFKRADIIAVGKLSKAQPPICVWALLHSRKFHVSADVGGKLVFHCEYCNDQDKCVRITHVPEVDTGFPPRNMGGEILSRKGKGTRATDQDWELPQTNLTRDLDGSHIRWILKRFPDTYREYIMIEAG